MAWRWFCWPPPNSGLNTNMKPERSIWGLTTGQSESHIQAIVVPACIACPFWLGKNLEIENSWRRQNAQENLYTLSETRGRLFLRRPEGLPDLNREEQNSLCLRVWMERNRFRYGNSNVSCGNESCNTHIPFWIHNVPYDINCFLNRKEYLELKV